MGNRKTKEEREALLQVNLTEAGDKTRDRLKPVYSQPGVCSLFYETYCLLRDTRISKTWLLFISFLQPACESSQLFILNAIAKLFDRGYQSSEETEAMILTFCLAGLQFVAQVTATYRSDVEIYRVSMDLASGTWKKSKLQDKRRPLEWKIPVRSSDEQIVHHGNEGSSRDSLINNYQDFLFRISTASGSIIALVSSFAVSFINVAVSSISMAVFMAIAVDIITTAVVAGLMLIWFAIGYLMFKWTTPQSMHAFGRLKTLFDVYWTNVVLGNEVNEDAWTKKFDKTFKDIDKNQRSARKWQFGGYFAATAIAYICMAGFFAYYLLRFRGNPDPSAPQADSTNQLKLLLILAFFPRLIAFIRTSLEFWKSYSQVVGVVRSNIIYFTYVLNRPNYDAAQAIKLFQNAARGGIQPSSITQSTQRADGTPVEPSGPLPALITDTMDFLHRLQPGTWCKLTGRNGTGKSSLLAIFAAKYPDECFLFPSQDSSHLLFQAKDKADISLKEEEDEEEEEKKGAETESSGIGGSISDGSDGQKKKRALTALIRYLRKAAASRSRVRYVLLDEWTTNLDEMNRREMEEGLQGLLHSFVFIDAIPSHQ